MSKEIFYRDEKYMSAIFMDELIDNEYNWKGNWGKGLSDKIQSPCQWKHMAVKLFILLLIKERY